ncbi:MAG: hypothetical protein JXB88_04585, partial [Spirochaetales bacterium]|nr:hypothetical protein [Spirochaetales bacterium]
AGNIFVTEYNRRLIKCYNADGEYLSQFGGSGSGPGLFSYPRGIAVSGTGFVYVADSGNDRVQKFGPRELEMNNESALDSDARFNYWGEQVLDEIQASDNPKDLSALDDSWDDASFGTIDYAYWLTNPLELTENHVFSHIYDPVPMTVLTGSSYTIKGIAYSPSGIDKVDISVDGGITWIAVTGKVQWSYTWTLPADGNYVIKTRVLPTGGQPVESSDVRNVKVDNSQVKRYAPVPFVAKSGIPAGIPDFLVQRYRTLPERYFIYRKWF